MRIKRDPRKNFNFKQLQVDDSKIIKIKTKQTKNIYMTK